MPRIAAMTTALLGLALADGCQTRNESASAESSLKLSYQAFDQTPHSGWRILAEDQKRYRDGAVLIEMYLDRHSELDQFQRANLHWHAGQFLAFAGDSRAALKHMSSALIYPELPGSPLRWNDYVEATMAFLRNDRAKLLAACESKAPKAPADSNLAVVDCLIAHFGASYATAYQAKR